MKGKTKIKQDKPKQINYKDLVYKYKLLSDLMDCVPDVIYFKDKKGRLIMVNKAHAKGLGLKPGEIVGKTDFDFFSKKRAEMMAKDDMYVLKTGKPIIDKIERATRADGVDNYVSTTKIPRYDDKGKIIGLIGITRDITRRMHLERIKEEKVRIEKRLEALEELNKLKSEFISTVSHELRTPLSIIKQLVMLVFNETTGPINEEQRETLKRARGNIERLKNIIDELLDISRIERDRFRLHYSLVNINELLRDSSDFFKKLAQDKGISLNYYLPKKQINLFMDVERVNQVLSNLIDNAIKFTEQGGKIKVEVKLLEAKVRIGVMDAGIGIAKSDLPKLFNKFAQVSKIPRVERKGVGLGLSIAKELVERHGGEIWVESKLGVGSKFYFTLLRFYTVSVLDKHIKDRINNFLDKGISVQFINLVIVNYREFKERVNVKPRSLFKDLKEIVDITFKEICRSDIEEPRIIQTDILNGKCSIIFPKATKKKATEVAKLLKDKLKRYFIKNKIEDVFIALGVLSYPKKVHPYTAKRLPVSLSIKEIYIGPEIRRFERIPYKANIKVLLPENKTEVTQTVNISEGGICFVSKRSLATDSQIKIELELPKNKKTIHVKARVAWIKEIGRLPGQAVNKYKVGLEFIGLKDKDRKILSKELKL